MSFIDIWKKIGNLGITNEMPIYRQKSTMFFNVSMRIYIIFMIVLALFLFLVKGVIYVPIAFIAGIPVVIFSLILNHKGKVNLSALIVAIFFPMYFIAMSIFSKSNGESNDFVFYILPRFGIIAITLISFIVLGFSNIIKAFLGIAIGLLSFFFFDKIHLLFNLSIYNIDLTKFDLNFMIYFIGSVFLFIILITTFLQKINFQYEKLVVSQKNKIEEIHHEVSQSIDYAKRLQQSILPNNKILSEYLKESFVLFKPKDKVSGDFYWWTHIDNYTIITAADCTGHGVPGAFMSMLGISFLREIVQKEQVTQPDIILNKLRNEVIKVLKQKGESGEQKDGMDMSLISINHKTNVVQFSGANNPLYIITSKTLNNYEKQTNLDMEAFDLNFYEIKPNKMPIAIYEKMDNFTTHEIQLNTGDMLYMFSDGYADQFGGNNGKKFKYKPFKQLLLNNAHKPMPAQKEILNNTFENWKGSTEQIDDVVVVGVILSAEKYCKL